ncbi:MAG: hypothetical protein M3Q55_05010, partial [Acidobacteriota bacterium]|nr:hypothetical protein [Acidobacteriota bacterium]
LSNQLSTASSHSGETRIVTSPGATRALLRTEGSVTGGLGSSLNEPTWTNRSTGTYNSYVINGRTGARRLELPLTSFGATPIDLIRRPVANEDATAANVLSQRFYSMASLRILLSDDPDEITGLPGVTQTPEPVQLGDIFNVIGLPGYAALGTFTAARPPFAVSNGNTAEGARTISGTPLLGGFLKIEMQDGGGNWEDVTLEILQQGIAGRPWPALDAATGATIGAPCGADPSPDAIIRIQRLRDGVACAGSTLATDFWPNVLYDPREGLLRDGHGNTTPPKYGGAMSYIELDVENLSDWFEGTLGTSGDRAIDVTGYVVYFSDRRGNNNAAGAETGEYGYEDIVNRASGGTWTGGTPNNLQETGEDLNGNGAQDDYGETPFPTAAMVTAPYNTAAIRPFTNIDHDGGADNGIIDAEDILIPRANQPVFFRRALKLVNGGLGNIVAPGLTVASENPVYVQGDWNANGGGFGNPHVATAVLADAVTMLSNSFSDRRSFQFAHSLDQRNATTTWYRVAIIAGKGLSFQGIAGANADYGTDGGAHNFLRYIEDWSGQTLNYRGAIASMYTSRQAVGTYKCCTDVYSPPTRAFAFDTDFLTPALLPPRTPMFRDVNTTGFAQIIRPR